MFVLKLNEKLCLATSGEIPQRSYGHLHYLLGLPEFRYNCTPRPLNAMYIFTVTCVGGSNELPIATATSYNVESVTYEQY